MTKDWDDVGQCWDDYFSSKVLNLLVLLVKINKSSQIPKKEVSKSAIDE